MSIAAEKRALRVGMRKAVAALPLETRKSLSRTIADRLLEHPTIRAAQHIALYASLPDEVATDTLLTGRWERGDPVYLPRMRSDGALDFVAVTGESDLATGRHGIREPKPALSARPVDALEVIVLPALALDQSGIRLGRGGGFYDRSLPPKRQVPGARRPLLAGIIFGLQFLDALPRAVHDLRVDLVVTEHGPEVPR